MCPPLAERIQAMSPEELAGQLLVLGFEGTEADAASGVLALLPAGLSLLPRNLTDAAQTARLASDLQQAVHTLGGAPLFLAADQEGGSITAVAEGTTVFPGAMALGAAGLPGLTRRMALAQGHEARAMGINLNYAPVADLNLDPDNPIIGVRSFGDDPSTVARHVAAAVHGYARAGILAAVKHFPGHGATKTDSHLDLPRLDSSLELLRRRELVPFRAAVAAGVGAVMTAHIIFDALDDQRPATLSPAVLKGLLRRELGFDGLILTDCLEMAAIAARYAPEEYAVAAIEAGADLLLISHTYDRQLAARDALAEAIRRGGLPRERVLDSVGRILSAKERLGLYGQGSNSLEPRRMLPRHVRLEADIAGRAVTLLKNDGLLPLPRENGRKTLVVWPLHAPRPRVGDPAASCPLGQAIRRHAPGAAECRVPLEPGEEDVRAVLAQAAACDLIIAATITARPAQSEAQLRMVRTLLALGKPLIVLALRRPYDLAQLDKANALIAAYDAGAAAVQAAADIIFGLRPARGRLPVDLTPDAGQVLRGALREGR